jgi:hypothetical protein
MKLFLNQIMNSRNTTTTATNNNNNNSETTTTDNSSSSTVLQHDYNQCEVVFSCNTRRSNTPSFGNWCSLNIDDDDDVSALTMPSCIFNRYYYPYTSIVEPTITPFLSIETELLDIQTDSIVPNEIQFAPFIASHNGTGNNNDTESSMGSDYCVIRRSFAYDEDDDDDDDDQKMTTTTNNDTNRSNETDDDDDCDDHNVNTLESNRTNTCGMVLSHSHEIENRSDKLRLQQQNGITTLIDGDSTTVVAKCDNKPPLSSPIRWTTNISIRNNRRRRRRRRSYKVSI